MFRSAHSTSLSKVAINLIRLSLQFVLSESAPPFPSLLNVFSFFLYRCCVLCFLCLFTTYNNTVYKKTEFQLKTFKLTESYSLIYVVWSEDRNVFEILTKMPVLFKGIIMHS